MTKAEIKDLIVASDYKNKDIVIWWSYKLGGLAHASKRIAIYNIGIDEFELNNCTYTIDIDYLADSICVDTEEQNFKLKILEVGND